MVLAKKVIDSIAGSYAGGGEGGGSNKPLFFAVRYVLVRMLEKCDSTNQQHVMARCVNAFLAAIYLNFKP